MEHMVDPRVRTRQIAAVGLVTSAALMVGVGAFFYARGEAWIGALLLAVAAADVGFAAYFVRTAR